MFNKLGISINVPDSKVHNISDDVFNEFKNYLSTDFESCVARKVHLNVSKEAKPLYCRARTVPIQMRSEIKKELDRLSESGKITKIFDSEWASPTVNVYKKDGNLRICGDYSVNVNRYLDAVHSPLVSIDDVICKINNAKVFSKVDLAQAFLQLPLDDESKKFTVINTTEGLYQYNFLPFGLSSSPGIFQSFISHVLDGIDNIIIYQDDILILTPDIDSHNDILRKVLKTLQECGIKLNNDKCKYFCDHVEYLGYIFDKSGIKPNPEKITPIINAPCPNNVKQVQSFIGLCNYYSRFIPNFASTMAPLYKLLQKNVPFSWGSEQNKCFQHVKQLFLNCNILQLYNPIYETMLETDASQYGLGAVLLQRQNKNCPWMPVQFASRTLNEAERNYSNIERESLSVIFGTDKFRHFLLGIKFIIRNDHKPLYKLLGHDKPIISPSSMRIQRWALKLSQYDYVFEYSRGSNNVQSDFLSRFPLTEFTSEDEPYELIFAVQSLDNLSSDIITSEIVKLHTERDNDLIELKNFIKNGCPEKIINPNLSKIKSLIPHMTLMKGCIMYQNKVLIPSSLRKSVLNLLHNDHPGICSMKSIARSLLWYPGIDRDIEMLVKSCPICQSVRSIPAQNTNITWPVPSRPFSRVHVDHFFYESKIFFILVDALTKYIECEIVSNTSVSETIDVLRLIFSRNGLPDVLCSDNATSFSGHLFTKFMIDNGIKHITPSPYSPASNGQAERGVRVMKDMLKKQNSTDSIKCRLYKSLLYYRCTPHSVTQIAPSVALNNRKYINIRDRINPNYNQVSEESRIDQSKQIPQFEIGDPVLALNVRDGRKWYRGTVTQRIAINIYLIKIIELDLIWKRHTNQLLPVPYDSNNQPTNNNNENDKSQPSVPVLRRSPRRTV